MVRTGAVDASRRVGLGRDCLDLRRAAAGRVRIRRAVEWPDVAVATPGRQAKESRDVERTEAR